MTYLQIVIGFLMGMLMIYLAARLISAAFFKSKQEHEQRKSK